MFAVKQYYNPKTKLLNIIRRLKPWKSESWGVKLPLKKLGIFFFYKVLRNSVHGTSVIITITEKNDTIKVYISK